jgi:hypothetical protein
MSIAITKIATAYVRESWLMMRRISDRASIGAIQRGERVLKHRLDQPRTFPPVHPQRPSTSISPALGRT